MIVKVYLKLSIKNLEEGWNYEVKRTNARVNRWHFLD